ncbi:MAG TPA: hypothetical protein PK587_03860 [Syntrophales bacterium]|nr:hypothetical protein [Syntrophales bacterium]
MSNYETERQEKSETRFAPVQRNGTEEMNGLISCWSSEIVAKGERIRSERNHIGDISRKSEISEYRPSKMPKKVYYALTHRKKKENARKWSALRIHACIRQKQR